MPGIKKKWIKASHDDQTIQDAPEDSEDIGDEDRELADPVEKKDVPPSPTLKPKKRPASSGMLKGLDNEVLLEKRKRFTPPAELKLAEWLDTNLEKRTEETLNLTQLYNYYTEVCQGEASDIVDVPLFNRTIKQKFGKAFGLRENSLYKSVIKERKLNQVKKSKSLGISVKDAAIEAITFHGNPWHGVRFFSLKQYIGSKYPALQIDLKPKVLKRSIEMQVQYGKLDLVKGIGMAGFYKIPGGEGPPPKIKPTKKSADGEIKDEDTKTADGETEKDETEENQESKENGDADGEIKDENEAEKKKTSKPKKIHPVKYSEISHGSPQRIEDTFPLAITYQSAPKASSVPRIRKYIQDKYGETVPDSRWRAAIDRGVDRGWWEHVSGSGMSGKILLLMDDFDPSSSSIEDQICAAIIACHEPKSASANQIKKYVSKYHPDFQVEEKPNAFKKALIRGVGKNIVVQVTGLGANGSFQLTAPFIPSPAILAGDDDSEDEDEEVDEKSNEYITKGTKSRGIPKEKRLDILKSPSRMKAASGRGRPALPKPKGKKQPAKPQGSKRGRKRSVSKGKGRKRSPSPLTDEEEEEEISEEEEEMSTSKSNKKNKSTKRGRSPSPLTDEEENPEYTPVKSKSRSLPAKGDSKSLKAKIVKDGKGGNTLKVNISTKNLKKSRGRPKGKTPSKVSVDVSELSGEEGDEAVEYSPNKSKSRGGGSSANKKKQNSKKSKPQEEDSDAVEGSEDAEEASEYTPKKSQSRGGGSAASSAKRPKTSGRKSVKDEEGSDGGDQSDAAPEYTPKKSKSRGAKSSSSSTSGKKKRGR